VRRELFVLVAKLEKTERRRDCGKDALGFGDLFPIGGDDIFNFVALPAERPNNLWVAH